MRDICRGLRSTIRSHLVERLQLKFTIYMRSIEITVDFKTSTLHCIVDIVVGMASQYFDIQDRALITDIGYLHKSHIVIKLECLEKVDQCLSCQIYKSDKTFRMLKR